MTVGRFTSVTAVSLVALGLIASSAAARPNNSQSTIVSVKASTQGVPAHESGPLAITRLNTVVANTTLAFTVRVHNPGTSRAAQVAVMFRLNGPRLNGGAVLNGATEKTTTIGVIGPGQTKTVTFSHLGAIWFGQETSLTISLGTGQAKTYPVIFSLPG